MQDIIGSYMILNLIPGFHFHDYDNGGDRADRSKLLDEQLCNHLMHI